MDFDRDFWQQQWQQGKMSMAGNPPNPYLAREIDGLVPGTALDAGCGSGAEAIWLAGQGWNVTAADISPKALAHAAQRANGAFEHLRWVEADLSAWTPETPFDLVMTHYAHPATSQLEFYERIAGWVAPGGTLFIVGHLHTEGGHGHHEDQGHHGSAGDHGHGDHGDHPAHASVTPEAVTALLDNGAWEIVTAEEQVRALNGRSLHDVVVRARRL